MINRSIQKMGKIRFLVTAVLLCMVAPVFLASCRQEPVLSGGAVVIPEPEPEPVYDRHWTTVIYMAADNDLEGNAIEDFREMLVAADGLREAGHTVLVLLDRAEGHDTSAFNWTDTRLFKIEPVEEPDAVNDFSFMQLDCRNLGLRKGTETELDMSSSETLRALLQYAQSEYPSDKYALVMWGHGCGWRGYAVDEDADDIMTLPRLRDAVSGLDQSLSVIAFDCCYGAMLETAYELRDDAEILVAAERDEPAAGWNYTHFFRQLVQWGTAEAGDSAAEGYARCIVNAFARQYADVRNASITVVDLSKAEDVFHAFDGFAADCAACLQDRASSVFFSSQIVSGSVSFLTGEYPAYAFVDIESLADSFLDRRLPSCSAALEEAAVLSAESLKEALAAATVVSFTGGSGLQRGMSENPMLAVYLATMRSGGIVEAEYPLLYVRGNGTGGQSSFVHDSTGWVPQHVVSQSTSLLDRLYRMPLP